MILSRATLICSLFVSFIAIFIFTGSQPRAALSSTVTTGDSATIPVIVLGFAGGFVRHDDTVHGEIQFAGRLRKEVPAGTIIETFENHSAEKAHQRIFALLGASHDGSLSGGRRRGARIILYGHSWGGSEVVTLARRLQKENIPILLTVQVDSVAKLGENDDIIPPNVAEAANFYQSDGLLHGESQIHAADQNRTRIIGNFRFRYNPASYSCTSYPWYARLFMNAHIQIECDPKVWDQVDSLIQTSVSRMPATN